MSEVYDYDTVIIGAGMSGLAAGIRLAQYDKSVCILEKHSMIGGLNSFYRQGNRNFDVGLHAMTNYTPKGTRTGPLSRILRHLRFSWDDLSLTQQLGSSIVFPSIALDFSNKPEVLEEEIRSKFPDEVDGYRKMVAGLVGYDQLGMGTAGGSARDYVMEHIKNPLLVDMLFCPLLYYGGSRANDMEFGQFCIMFRAIFLEGFARPFQGVRHILLQMQKKFKTLGGDLRLRQGVKQIVSKNNIVEKVILEDGSEIVAKQFLSSAGWPETMKLCNLPEAIPLLPAGQLGFIETISVLNCDPKKLGHRKTIVFFNDSNSFSYEKPDSLVDLRSGVICSPNNFDYKESLGEGIIRITALANYDQWKALSEKEYHLQKLKWYEKSLAAAVRFVPDFRTNIVQNDMFTPLTIKRFTGRENGAIYGTAKKKYDGLTPLNNLFVCGTDQGMLGIVGAIVSGITIANRYILNE